MTEESRPDTKGAKSIGGRIHQTTKAQSNDKGSTAKAEIQPGPIGLGGFGQNEKMHDEPRANSEA
jgi:hypothetical protein